MAYNDFNCKKCGRLVKKGEYSSHVYYPICPDCNNQFWNKWYLLPKCKKVEGEWVRTPAHTKLIQEYYKESYFNMK